MKNGKQENASNRWRFLLKTWGSLAIATAALMQPWCFSLWETVFRGGELIIHRTGRLQLSVTDAGPAITIDGTLEAKDRPFFVRRATIAISLPKNDKLDQTEVLLEWRSFRSTGIQMGGGPPSGIAQGTPFGFLVHPKQPRQYGIVFSDFNKWLDIRDTEAEFGIGWFNVRKTQFGWLSHQPPSMPLPPPMIAQVENKFVEHVNSDLGRRFQAAIEASNIWIPGEYSAKLRFYVSESTEPIEDNFRFVLNEADVKRLRSYEEVLRLVSSHWPKGPRPEININYR